MLIHISPRFYTCDLSGPDVELVDLRIDQLALSLRGRVDLATRRPYPNKRYVVGCRKVGQRAIDGILVETPGRVSEYTVVTRWAIGAEAVVTHQVHHVVLDQEHDAISDSMVLWHAMSAGLGGWRSRWPDAHKGAVPASAQPRMQLSGDPERTGLIEDRMSGRFIAERIETFPVPTIERDRLLSSVRIHDRVPPIESAFKIG